MNMKGGTSGDVPQRPKETEEGGAPRRSSGRRMKTRRYRLPDGTATTNPVAYATAWRALAAPFEEAGMLKLYAFDPDLAFFATKNPYCGVTVPVAAALRMAKLTPEEQAGARAVVTAMAQPGRCW